MEKKIIDYTFAWGNGAVQLQTNVNALIKNGWQPQGAAQHIYFEEANNDHIKGWDSYQTMVKYEK